MIKAHILQRYYKRSPRHQLTKPTNFRTAILKNTCEKLLLFYKSMYFKKAYYEICSPQNRSKSSSIDAHQNTECIDLRF